MNRSRIFRLFVGDRREPGMIATARRGAAAIAVAALLSSCATWSAHGVTADDSGKLRIAVLPVTSDVEIGDLGEIATLPAPVPPAEATLQIRARMTAVTDEITQALEQRLATSPYLEVVGHEPVSKVLGTVALPLTPQQLQQLHSRLDVQAVLAVQISGYGQLKRKWVLYLLGSGVVEGVAQGLAVGKATGSAWAGLAVGGEEILQEFLVWGGGARLFDWRFAPVILEGSITSTVDGEEVWSDTAFTSIDTKALKRVPRAERERKEVQLRVTTERATHELVKDLLKAAKREVHG
jgi:hypothetical protein